MNGKHHPELTWIGKENRPEPGPHLLVEDAAISYRCQSPVADHDLFDNLLVFGDSLPALDALRPEFAGGIKCAILDPPYNTGSVFRHYDDRFDPDAWLSFMQVRLERLQPLLSEDGSLWIILDDKEAHYLKVLCDGVFGRSNFLATVIWQKKYTRANDARFFSATHDFILVYAKNKKKCRLNGLPRGARQDARYRNRDGHPNNPWKSTPLHAKSGSPDMVFSHTFRNGVTWSPPPGTYSMYARRSLESMDANGEIWFGKNGLAIPSRMTFLNGLRRSTLVPTTIWPWNEVGHNAEAKLEARNLNPDDPFDTPKPERLMQRILTLATNPGDLVLDPFAGGGTTGAVAHKMRRRWIMIELGAHCDTHIVPRMRKVIAGEDSRGVTSATGWTGGGGFRYFRLVPSEDGSSSRPAVRECLR